MLVNPTLIPMKKCHHCGKSQEEKTQEFLRIIKKCGWADHSIFDTQPPFNYTTGMHQAYQQGDFIIIGLPGEWCHVLLSELEIRYLKPKHKLQDREVLDLNSPPVMVRNIPYDEVVWDDYFGQGKLIAKKLYGHVQPIMRQLVWTDKQGRYPWNPGFGARMQPVLADLVVAKNN